jgi:hypothetical protein
MANSSTTSTKLLRKHIALPQDHGSWVFLFSPLLIGLFAGGKWSMATAFLVVGALAAFLIRQPVTVIIKAYSGRRSTRDLPTAYFWTGIYSLAGLISLIALIQLGYQFVLLLAIPAIPVFIWHLLLISRRAERKQIGVEIVGIGVLALAAPAAYWVAVNSPAQAGWWLWILTWFQGAASIVYAYLRLEQRELKTLPSIQVRLKMGRRAISYTTFNFAAVLILSITGVLPNLLPLAYFLQWSETIYGTFTPAIGFKPTRIGIRQLIISSLFGVIFILTWIFSP